MSKLLEKIEADKEILSTMPKNNKKNIAKYIQKVQELKKEYETEKEKTYKIPPEESMSISLPENENDYITIPLVPNKEIEHEM